MWPARAGAPPPRKRPSSNVLRASVTILIAASIGFAVVGILARHPHVQLHFVAGWLCLSIAGFLLVALVQSLLWRSLLAALGCRLEWRRGLAIWWLSAPARYVPTSMLMPILRVNMSRTQEVPVVVCAASLVYEAVLAICGSLWIASYVVIGLPALHGSAWRWGVLLLPLVFMLALHPTAIRFVSHPLLRRLGREPLPMDLSLKRLSIFTAVYAANFLLSGVSLVALVLAFHPLEPQNTPVVIGAFALGFAASAFGFLLPGGLGAREAALVGALSLVMPTFIAATVAVASRLIQLGLELMLALTMPWLAVRHESRLRATL
jgi:glycosyltransferase 2 family protein